MYTYILITLHLKILTMNIKMSLENTHIINDFLTEPKSNIIDSNNNDIRILYITFCIIIGILFIWVIIVVFTKDDPIKILGEMNKLTSQIPPTNDIKNTTPFLPQNFLMQENIITPKDYNNDVFISSENNNISPAI